MEDEAKVNDEIFREALFQSEEWVERQVREQERVKRLLKQIKRGGFGPCEKADVCPYASEQCKLAYNLGAMLYRKRFLLCWAWIKNKQNFVGI